ncbi:MAG TPA: GAF domain-containing protein [Terracidiphilus sp.]|jgi:GAF domain-containing protein
MAEFSNDKAGINPLEERARLTALHSLGILDTPAEPGYDAITRLAVDYFQVDSAIIAFADDTRVWVKSNWGEMPRELPRANSMFDFVLAEDGPVVICDISQHPDTQGRMLHLHRLEVRFVASVPVRAFDGNVVGMLSIFGKQMRPALTPNELRTLVNLAVMVSNQLELHKLRRARSGVAQAGRPLRARRRHRGRGPRICGGPSIVTSWCCFISRKSTWSRSGLSVSKL